MLRFKNCLKVFWHNGLFSFSYKEISKVLLNFFQITCLILICNKDVSLLSNPHNPVMQIQMNN